VERVVARFVARLRREGIRVSPGECVDAVHALARADVADRRKTRAALQLTLVKSVKDLPVFEAVFAAFFRSDDGEEARAGAADVVPDGAAALHPRRSREAPAEEGERSGLTLLTEDEEEDGEGLDLDGLEGLDGDGRVAATLTVQSRRHGGEKAKEARPQSYTRGPIYYRTDDEFLSRWRNDGVKPFTPEEEAAMAEVVARMIRRLKKDVRALRAKQRRGRLHLVKTLRKNYRHGMVPFVRALRRRRKQTPRLVVLCDVSYSVSHASRFMLLLLHALQQGVLDVRSFVFNRELAEVTSLLEALPVNATLEAIDRGELVNLQDHSDFGHVFRTFQAEHLASLRGRPAVLILGDARNNYNEASEEVLAEVRERAGYVMWLTPEDRSSWELGDCLMSTYGPSCDRVEVVKNVDELSAVVEELVRGSYAGGAAAPRRERRPWQHGGVEVRT
jgi:uncharacterized protein with von Willebrand factor type A (vWA) domain